MASSLSQMSSVSILPYLCTIQVCSFVKLVGARFNFLNHSFALPLKFNLAILNNLSVATLALGSRPRQRACKGVNQEEARESKQEEEARESHHKLLGVLESVREYEGMNPHTPKATPTLGDGVPVDSQNFKERLQGSKPNGLWRSLYHWKALGT